MYCFVTDIKETLAVFSSGQKTSMPAIMCCGVIVGGFMLGVDQESLAGILFCLSDMHLFFLINVAYIVIEMTLLVFDFFTYHEMN